MTDDFLPIDQETRTRAIETHDVLFCVEAGAGTGKTSVLTSRYVSIVESGKATPAEIVAITFTALASGELRSRIRNALLEKNLTEAARELDRAPISTIHSFGKSLLMEHPLEAGLDPGFEAMDSIDSTAFIDRSYERWLNEALEHGEAIVTRALSAGIGLPKIRTLAMEMHKNRDLVDKVAYPTETFDLGDDFQSMLSEVQDIWGKAQQECRDISDEGYRSVEELARQFAALQNSPAAFQERALLLRLDVKAKGNQKAWSSPAHMKKQKERLKTLGERVTSARNKIRKQVFSDLLRWLSHFPSFAEKEKREASRVDFDDLLLLPRNLLRDHPDVRDHFRRRYKFVLVDEFQDTDPIQTELIWRLCGKPGSEGAWETLPLVPGKLFLVGDPKQSIYRFRRASIEVFSKATESLRSQGEHLVIRQNFRSSASLIQWVNAAFGALLPGQYEALSVDPRHEASEEGHGVTLLDPPLLEGSEGQSHRRRLEAEMIAAHLRDLLDRASKSVWDRYDHRLRPCRPGDIAILFPSTTGIDLFEEAFRRYGIPFSVEGSKIFYARTEIHGFIAGLSAIEHPTDPIAVVAALRCCLFGLSDVEVLALSRVLRTFDYRLEISESSLSPGTREALRILRSLHSRKTDLSSSEIARHLLVETAAIPLSLTRFHGEQAAANLGKLLSMIHSIERRGPITLSGLLRFFKERALEEEQQDESPLADGDSGRMRLMTVHKAKGLEFPVVVLANLSVTKKHTEHILADRLNQRLAVASGPKDALFSTPDFETLSLAEEVRRDEERLRLLYVATTRARDHLILPRVPPSKGTSLYWSILDKGLEAASAFTRTVAGSELRFLPADSPPTLLTHTSPDEALNLFKERESLRKDFLARPSRWTPGLAIQTASSLGHTETVFLASEGTSPHRGRAIGVALHAVLERGLRADAARLGQLARQAAFDQGIPEAVDEIEQLARHALDSDVLKRARRSKKVMPEVPFSLKRRDELFEGVMDLIFLEEDQWVLVDYKTDRVTAEAAPAKAETYRLQMDLYRDALTTLTGLAVREAALLFVRVPLAVSLS